MESSGESFCRDKGEKSAKLRAVKGAACMNRDYYICKGTGSFSLILVFKSDCFLFKK